MKTLGWSLLALALLLPPPAEAQVSWGSGSIGFQLGVYGRVRVGAPAYNGTRHLDRASVVAALDTSSVFDYTQDANTVESPAFIHVNGVDTAATNVTDNSYSHKPPKVRARTTVWGWQGKPYLVFRYTIFNDTTITLPLHLGTAVVPQLANTYGLETCQYDSTRQVAYYFRGTGANYIGFKYLDGTPASFHVRDWDAYSPDPSSDLATDATRYAMTAPAGYDPPLTGGANGTIFHFNAGLTSIPAGGSVTISYAVIYATSLTTLLDQADSAQARYNSVLPPIVHDLSMVALRQQLGGTIPGSVNVPVTLRAYVQNYGAFVENSYQIGWEIDGVPQTPVSNASPVGVGAGDTLSLVWPVATPGVHLVRAWTILSTDSIRTNDSSVTRGVFITPPYTIFEERFNGTFPPPGWTTVNRDGGGTSGPWGQGSTGRFLALEGTDNGYAGDAYTTADSLYIDDYLITPNTGTPPDPVAVDSLIFYARSYDSPYPDSLEIRVSTTGADTASFTTLLDYIDVPKTGWTRFAYRIPVAGTRYIAFRYLMYDGGSAGNNSVYVGIDAVHIVRHSTTSWTAGVSLGTGWNMVSNPVVTTADSMRQLFPQSTFAYGFGFSSGGGYQQVYQLEGGKGYWGKMNAAHTQSISGGVRTSAVVPVSAGWNMIGALSTSIDTSAAHISTAPPGLRASNWFKYKPAPAAGYAVATDLLPGYGYWVKSSGNGTFTLTAAAPVPGGVASENDGRDPLAALQALTVADAGGNSQTLYFGADAERAVPVAMFELPPAPPQGTFDVRFSSGTMVQTLGTSREGEFRVKISATSPVTITWNVSEDGNTYVLADEAGLIGSTVLRGTGSLTIQRTVARLLLRATAGTLLPTEFALAQNFPNPFNPSTTVTFALPVPGRVTADIYDVLGRHVRTLVDDQRPAGYHSAVWDGTNAAGELLGSGTYFLRLRVEGERSFTGTRKMLLMK